MKYIGLVSVLQVKSTFSSKIITNKYQVFTGILNISTILIDVFVDNITIMVLMPTDFESNNPCLSIPLLLIWSATVLNK